MTVIPTQPDLRRNLFQPGDRVRVAACAPKLCLDPDAHLAIGTVQPYPKDTASIEVVYDGEQEPVVYYVEELDLLQLVEPAAAPEVVDENAPVANPNVCDHGYRFENALCPHAECGASAAVEPAERACRQCGCTTENACQSAGPAGLETCSWAEIDLCSTCADDQATDVPDAAEVPDYASSAYLAAVNLLALTEHLDRQHDVCLSIGWDGSGGRETNLHVDADAGFAAAEALAARIGLTEHATRPHKGDVHHRWTGERHGLPVRVAWIDRAAAGWHPEAGA